MKPGVPSFHVIQFITENKTGIVLPTLTKIGQRSSYDYRGRGYVKSVTTVKCEKLCMQRNNGPSSNLSSCNRNTEEASRYSLVEHTVYKTSYTDCFEMRKKVLKIYLNIFIKDFNKLAPDIVYSIS